MYVSELHTETRTTTNSNLAVLFKCRSNSAGQATKTHLLRGRKFTFENRWRQLRSRHIREILQRNKGVWGGGNSINYKIPTELVWLGKFDCPEIIEEGFLNNFEFFLHPKPPLFAMDHQNDPKRYVAWRGTTTDGCVTYASGMP